jgi:hypothetical protein
MGENMDTRTLSDLNLMRHGNVLDKVVFYFDVNIYFGW